MKLVIVEGVAAGMSIATRAVAASWAAYIPLLSRRIP